MKWFVAGDPLRGLATLGIVAVHAGSAALNATGAGSVHLLRRRAPSASGSSSCCPAT